MQASRWHAVFVALIAALLPLAAHAWPRGEVERFATLPAGEGHPEGSAADGHGAIYVSTFDLRRASAGSPGPGRMFVFDRHGELLRTVMIAGASHLLLDLAFHPTSGALLAVDFGNQRVLTVDPHTGASSVFATIPGGAAAGPNMLHFDRAGSVYLSDSFQGVIWKIPAAGGAPERWVDHPSLRTMGVPPFGAVGLGFNRAGDAMFVAVSGNDQIVRIPVTAGVPGTPAVFVNSVNGPSGLLIDEDDNLWITASQADEVVVLDPTGRVIAKLGDFDGISRRGAPRGLLFPVGLLRVGDWLYVSNLSLDLRVFGLAPPVDAQWAAEVRRYTVSRLKAKIPPVRGQRRDVNERRGDD